jgi:hypothetical protein
MKTKPVRLSEMVQKDIREIGTEIGSPADDTVVRHILAEFKRMRIEIELLQNKLKDCESKSLK